MKKTSFFKIIFASLFAVVAVVIVLDVSKKNLPQATTQKESEVKIGYFLGGRTQLLYRAYTNNEFEKAGVSVKLITKNLYEPEFYVLSKIPRTAEDRAKKLYAKASGRELIESVVKGEFDGATPGESSFIEAVGRGLPMVAVAMLGYDTKQSPGHAIIFRKDVVIKTPQDIKGKTLATRRAGPGDELFLREFLLSIGLDPDKDVTISDGVKDDRFKKVLIDGEIDGGYYHLNMIKDLVEEDHAYVYRKLDWVNPELSHALLVFHKDYVKKYPDKIKSIIRVYMERIQNEQSLVPKDDFMGMNLPQYDFPPRVRPELLNEMQDLLLKHQVIDKKVDLSDFIDNRFVEGVYEELK